MYFDVFTRKGMLTVLVCLSLFVSVFCIAKPTELVKRSSSNDLINLGSVEGKTYYAETTRGGTWTSSRAICQAAGLHLASITTPVQSEFIFKSKASVVASPYYWTGGRDARNITQFEWDHNSETPIDGILPFEWKAGLKTCLVLYSGRNYYIRYLTYGCDDQVSAFTLCEKIDKTSDKKSDVWSSNDMTTKTSEFLS